MVELYVKDIYNALNNKCYFPALAMSLALPDICSTAEYPHETSVAKRYIEWYNKYLGEYMSNEKDSPFLSGEVVYNLRNTFLHTGSPNIDNSKVKNEANQLDRFILILGDGTKFWSTTLFIDTPIVKMRTMMVDITYLCQTICDCSLLYYKHNFNKFQFDFSINIQEHLFSSESEPYSGNPIIKAVNQKLEKSGETLRFHEQQANNTADTIIGCLNYTLSNDELKQRFVNEEKITLLEDSIPDNMQTSQSKRTHTSKKSSTPKKKTDTKKKNTKSDKREAQIRSFFGQHFKEKKYKQKKEIIIHAVLASKTKQQVNNTLMKSFSSEDTGVIYKRLSPLLTSLPSK
ncbi:MAG: hypothetical protein K2J37_05995 [Ruminococcus sp.]|nr:hypothetical protein [Ruminococcus sp.]